MVSFVKVNSSLSQAVPCSRGVPQGSVLAPLLFVLYTRRLHDILPKNVHHQEFADDILLDCSDCDSAVICSSLSRAVTDVAAWLSDIGLLLNAKKTQIMFVCPRNVTVSEGNVFCGTEKLDTISTAKYLGLEIDNDLSWKSRIDNLSSKVSKLAGAMWRNGKSLTLSARRTWLVAIVRAHLTYASNAFVPSISMSELDRLEKLHKYCVRTVFRVHPPTSSKPLLDKLELRPLPDVFRRKIAMFVFRCLTGLASDMFEGMFQNISSTSDTRRMPTRGHTGRLLRVPAVHGLLGSKTMSFYGSVLWNGLPSHVRMQESKQRFRLAYTAECEGR